MVAFFFGNWQCELLVAQEEEAENMRERKKNKKKSEEESSLQTREKRERGKREKEDYPSTATVASIIVGASFIGGPSVINDWQEQLEMREG